MLDLLTLIWTELELPEILLPFAFATSDPDALFVLGGVSLTSQGTGFQNSSDVYMLSINSNSEQTPRSARNIEM